MAVEAGSRVNEHDGDYLGAKLGNRPPCVGTKDGGGNGITREGTKGYDSEEVFM